MMAGTSTDDVTSAAASLKSSGVTVMCLGMGGSFDQAQLVSMVTMESYALTASSWTQVATMSSQFVTLITQGMF